MSRLTSGKRLLAIVIAITALVAVVGFVEPVFLPLALAAGLVVPALLKPLSSRNDASRDRTETTSLLHSTLESTTDGILVVSLTGRILSHNRRFLELWGLAPHVVAFGDSAALSSVLPKVVDRDGFLHRLRELYADPEAIATDVIGLLDGRVFERSTRPHRNEGEVVGRVWSFRDTTAQHQAAVALAQSESRFRRMAANVPGVIFQFYLTREHSLRFTYLSQGCKTLLGVEPDRFPWRADSLLSRIHVDDFGALKAAAMQSARLMEPWSWDGRVSLSDGSIRWLRAASRPVRDADGRLSWDGMLMDISEQKAAEQALSESEERFRQMAENIREVFYMASVETNELIYLSPAYRDVWGLSYSEGIDDAGAFIEAIVLEDRQIILRHFELSRAGEADRQQTFDYRIERPDGTIRWIRNRTFQIYGQDGGPYRLAGVCTDITEQKQMEEELRRANRIEAIGHLAAGIAHEINTPIQYIGDNVRFLDESAVDIRTALDAYRAFVTEASTEPITTERIAELEAVIQRSDVEYVLAEAPRASAQALDGVRRVAEIVRAMKEFSHPGTGDKVPTDLNQAILSTTTVARNEWKYVAELVTELDPAIPMIHCLPGELNQAILNLVVNAAHAIADRRDVTRMEAQGLITLSTSATDEFVEIRVSDTGIGIPDEIRPRIFDPFFTTKEVGRGTGQGLTFVHSIVVEKHGGTVTFETECGVGTTFSIRLPHGAPAVALSEAA